MGWILGWLAKPTPKSEASLNQFRAAMRLPCFSTYIALSPSTFAAVQKALRSWRYLSALLFLANVLAVHALSKVKVVLLKSILATHLRLGYSIRSPLNILGFQLPTALDNTLAKLDNTIPLGLICNWCSTTAS